MKILLTTHALRNKAGTERYTYEIAKELKSRSHEILVYTPNKGEFAETFQDIDIKVTSDADEIKSGKFDVASVHHNVSAIILRSLQPKLPIVFISHGVLPELEQPPSIDIGISEYVAVSEEVEENLKVRHKIKDNLSIVRNFVDTEKFQPKGEINHELKNLLVISNHYVDEVKEVIETVCKKRKIKITHIGLPNNPVDDVEKYINQNDLVVTLGKGALESMSCGRNVIIYDMHGGDGFLDKDRYLESRKNNLSGRRFAKKYTLEDFGAELDKYDKKLSAQLREIVLSNHTVKKAVDDLEEIYKQGINNEVISKVNEGELLEELLFLDRFFADSEDQYFAIKILNEKVAELEKENRKASKYISDQDKRIKQQEEAIKSLQKRFTNRIISKLKK